MAQGQQSGAVRVGVTGHRTGQLADADRARLRAQVRQALSQVVAAAGNRGVEVVSALAAGADQLVATEALGMGFTLHAPLPFLRGSYERDFDAADGAAFRSLLVRATVVEELPGARTSPETETAAYVAVANRVLDGADLLLAVWDGLPARGEGGTGDVVRNALGRGMAVVVIDARPPHGIRYLGEPPDGITWELARQIQ